MYVLLTEDLLLFVDDQGLFEVIKSKVPRFLGLFSACQVTKLAPLDTICKCLKVKVTVVDNLSYGIFVLFEVLDDELHLLQEVHAKLFADMSLKHSRLIDTLVLLNFGQHSVG